jgi:hypothetical protein
MLRVKEGFHESAEAFLILYAEKVIIWFQRTHIYILMVNGNAAYVCAKENISIGSRQNQKARLLGPQLLPRRNNVHAIQARSSNVQKGGLI